MSRKGILIVAVLFGIAFLLLGVATRGYRGIGAMQSMEKAMEAARREFPGARPVSSAELASWLEEPDGVVLIDARETEEFAVSRLPGACQEANAEKLPGLEAVKAVVVYDSVGFRSAGLGQRLREGGVANVFYLEGGIFQWANEGRPLVDAGGKPTTKVHPYNKLWGRLLESRRP